MKKWILVLACGLLLTGCTPAPAGSASGSDSAAGTSQSVVDQSAPETPKAVKAAVEMQEGMYDDEHSYGEQGGYFEGDSFIQYDYYGVEVKNVTDTSFDFTLFLYAGEGEKKPREVAAGTAIFVEDGMKAVCEEMTFTFPNQWESLPAVVDFRIEGYEPVNGVLFANNDVPGYEFS